MSKQFIADKFVHISDPAPTKFWKADGSLDATVYATAASVSAIHPALSLGAAQNGLALVGATQVLQLGLASAGVAGALSGTDWTTFNNKQSAITAAALTKVDDTNVTLTLGGAPTTALLSAVSLTLGWSGTLADARITSAANWNLAYADRMKWDGAATGLVAATGRASLGGTTIGQSMFTLINPSAITFPRFNADNTVTALDAAAFRTAIGAGTSSATGSVTSVTSALTATGTDVTLTIGGVPTVTPSVNLNIPSSSATNRGVLTAADWTLFNGKASVAYVDTQDTTTLNTAKAYADSLVVGLIDDRGNWNASGGTFPATGGSGTAGAIMKGDLWYVSVAGTMGGIPYNIGDSFRALVDSPGQTASNWGPMEGNVGYVPANELITIATTSPLLGGGNLQANRTLSIQVANTSQGGYLTPGDWNTFNGKIGGSGSIGTIPKFTAAGAIGNSNISDSGTLVTIAVNTKINGSLQVGGDALASPALADVGKLRYTVTGNNSYVDMVMQTGAATFAWVNIVQNNW